MWGRTNFVILDLLNITIKIELYKKRYFWQLKEAY